jgi:hypothetical protein
MNSFFFQLLLSFIILTLPMGASAQISVGVGKAELTPPPGTPSAGYSERKGEGMEGVHDPLLALALFIDNGLKKIVFCSVDHLGFTYGMYQAIADQVHLHPGLEACEIYIGSSHTHSGGGAYLDLPLIGESLAGPYDAQLTKFAIQKTVEAIVQASQKPVLAKIGIGYGQADAISRYRGLWPVDIDPLSDVAILKITHLDNTPLAVLFNYPLHPTLLQSQNRLFSADFVGYAREHLKNALGEGVQAMYFNGAQGDIIPVVSNEENRFASCQDVGEKLANTVAKIWATTEAIPTLEIDFQKEAYAFTPQPTPFGLKLPIEKYETEMNILVLNRLHAFITIPGELSCLYDQSYKEFGKSLGYRNVSILGLTNDAHGYIILPAAWQHKTFESTLSFGGENYGETLKDRVFLLLRGYAPN